MAMVIFRGLDATAIEKNSSALIFSAGDTPFNTGCAIGCDNWAKFGTFLKASVDLELPGLFCDIRELLLCLIRVDFEGSGTDEILYSGGPSWSEAM